MKNTFGKLHDAFHVADKKITSSDDRSMSTSYKPDVPGFGRAANIPKPPSLDAGFMPKKPQTPAQHASVKKAAQASVAKRRGLMPLTAKPVKSFI